MPIDTAASPDGFISLIRPTLLLILLCAGALGGACTAVINQQISINPQPMGKSKNSPFLSLSLFLFFFLTLLLSIFDEGNFKDLFSMIST